jgi:hypothetical protein
MAREIKLACSPEVWQHRIERMQRLCRLKAPPIIIISEAFTLLRSYGLRRALWFNWRLHYWSSFVIWLWGFWHRTICRKSQAEIERMIDQEIER